MELTLAGADLLTVTPEWQPWPELTLAGADPDHSDLGWG